MTSPSSVIEWVRVGGPQVVSFVVEGSPLSLDWVHHEPPVFVGDPPSAPDVLSLDALTDVDGAAGAPVGDVLAKSSDGQWRPVAPLVGAAPESFRFNQLIAAAVWTINHNLGRFPVTVTLHNADLSVEYDEFLVQHLSINSLRVSMDTPTSGAALLI
jgi:hypothetical protein